ncbi:MAG: hypothetical protein LBR89_04605 [Holosporales bacterium]|nr:hypothetical protein [Holosporales bacterium]
MPRSFDIGAGAGPGPSSWAFASAFNPEGENGLLGGAFDCSFGGAFDCSPCYASRGLLDEAFDCASVLDFVPNPSETGF